MIPVHPSAVQHAVRPASWWPVIRTLLATVWAVWLVSSWWAAPRETGLAQVRADLAAGRVESYRQGDTWSDATGFSWNRHVALRSWSSDGPLLVWMTTGGRLQYTITDVVPDASPGEPTVRPGGQ
jgi:hypothetical protein